MVRTYSLVSLSKRVSSCSFSAARDQNQIMGTPLECRRLSNARRRKRETRERLDAKDRRDDECVVRHRRHRRRQKRGVKEGGVERRVAAVEYSELCRVMMPAGSIG